MKKIKKVEKKEVEKVEKKEEKTIKVSEETVINRVGYSIHFLSPSDENGKNDLTNTGKVFGSIVNYEVTADDKPNEVILFVRN